jgi:hypothetical protein
MFFVNGRHDGAYDIDSLTAALRAAQEGLSAGTARTSPLNAGHADGYRPRRPIGLPSASASTHTRASGAT